MKIEITHLLTALGVALGALQLLITLFGPFAAITTTLCVLSFAAGHAYAAHRLHEP
jgi:uncharacterized membrane protein YkgB